MPGQSRRHVPEGSSTRRAKAAEAQKQADVDAYAGFTSHRYSAIERALPSVSVVSLKGEQSKQNPAYIYEGLIETLARSNIPVEHLEGLEGGITVHRGQREELKSQSGRYQPDWEAGGDVPATRQAGIELWLSGQNLQDSVARQRSAVHEVGHHVTIANIKTDAAQFNGPKDLYERGAAEAMADNYASMRFIPQQGTGKVPASYYDTIVRRGEAHPDFAIAYDRKRDRSIRRAAIGVMDAPPPPPMGAGRLSRSERARVTRKAGQPKSRSKKK